MIAGADLSGQGESVAGDEEDVVRGGLFGLDGASADAGGGGPAAGDMPEDVPALGGRYEDHGIDGLRDKRLSRASHRAAPVDRYRTRHEGWNVRHFCSWYRRDGGERSYGWVKDHLQRAGAVPRSKGRGKHRKRRERAPWPGMLLHQDGSDHAWIEGERWDLIVTMDDATSKHYSMFF